MWPGPGVSYTATTMPASHIVALDPASAEHVQAARELFGEIALTLPSALQDSAFASERAQLPGDYVLPGGILLLAHVDGVLAGCGALRACPGTDYPNACEIKRLYVRPAMRRLGLGRELALELIDRAREAGYSVVLLDTFSETEAVRGLYADLGFESIEPYYFNPVAGSHYFKIDLDDLISRF